MPSRVWNRQRSACSCVLITLVLGLTIALGVSSCGSSKENRQASETVRRYLDLLSTGTGNNLHDLKDLLPSDDHHDAELLDGALAGATERIHDLSIGKGVSVDAVRSPSDVTMDDLTTFPVGYTLGGSRHHSEITVGRPEDGSSWVIATPLYASVPLSSLRFTSQTSIRVDSAAAAVRLGGQAMPPQAIAPGGPDTDLFPAVYELHTDIGDDYATQPVEIVATPSSGRIQVPPISFALSRHGTRTVDRAFYQALSRCHPDSAWCPIHGLVADSLPKDWWIRMVKKPKLTIRKDVLTFTDAVLRYRSPTGVRTMKFQGITHVAVEDGSASGAVSISPEHREPTVTVPFWKLRVTR